MRRNSDWKRSSGNVFKDLGLPDPEELDTKANLAIAIARLIRKRELTQIEAARMLKIDQPKVSAIACGRLEKFSVERLCELLTRLGCDVDIRIREKRHKKVGRFRVRVA